MRAFDAVALVRRLVLRRDWRNAVALQEGRAVSDETAQWRARAIAAEALVARLELLVYADRPSTANPSGTTWMARAHRLEADLHKCRNVLPRRIEHILYEGEG